MKDLKELKESHKRLGKEIKAFENLDKIKYPIYCKGVDGLIVKFTSLTNGIVIRSNKYNHSKLKNNYWIIHTDNNVWEELSICPQTGFYDKQPIWCWNDNDICKRTLKFYDAKNSVTFYSSGNRDGYSYNNYKPFEGEWMDWMNNAFDNLK